MILRDGSAVRFVASGALEVTTPDGSAWPITEWSLRTPTAEQITTEERTAILEELRRALAAEATNAPIFVVTSEGIAARLPFERSPLSWLTWEEIDRIRAGCRPNGGL